MLIGFVILFIAVFIIIIGRLAMIKMNDKNKKKIKKLTRNLKIQVIHGVHTTVNTGSIPL